MGAKEVILVDDVSKIYSLKDKMDYMISGFFTQVGMPEGFSITLNNLGLSASKVNFNASLIGGMKETQEMVDYCAKNNVLPEIQIIKAQENKEARYRYVIDASTF